MSQAVRTRAATVGIIISVLVLMVFLAMSCTPDLADPAPVRGFAS